MRRDLWLDIACLFEDAVGSAEGMPENGRVDVNGQVANLTTEMVKGGES